MDTWTDKKLSTKSEKSKHTRMKQIILPSAILGFTWLVINGPMEENDLALSPKKDISSRQ